MYEVAEDLNVIFFPYFNLKLDSSFLSIEEFVKDVDGMEPKLVKSTNIYNYINF